MKLCAHTIFSVGKRVVCSDQKKHTMVFELGSEVFEFEKKVVRIETKGFRN